MPEIDKAAALIAELQLELLKAREDVARVDYHEAHVGQGHPTVVWQRIVNPHGWAWWWMGRTYPTWREAIDAAKEGRSDESHH